ncbi:hypothetical protein QNN00_17925 [Bacillus velezensis]|nr:hypothetical protein [Bacillus velezensis]
MQTSISEEKHNEIMKWFPLMKNELAGRPSLLKTLLRLSFLLEEFILCWQMHSLQKGQRRRRLNVEESALLNNELFKDVLEPVVNVPRRTIGKLATVNPLN